MDEQIKIGVSFHCQIPNEIISELINRDVALLLGKGICGFDSEVVGQLFNVPWRLILCEDDSDKFFQQISQMTKTRDACASKRGLFEIIARNPEDISLPPRTIPFYFLNGVAGSAVPEESNKLGKQPSLRRRLNMLKRLLDERPRRLIIISNGDKETLETVQSLWEENFQARLYYVASDETEIERLGEWSTKINAPPIIEVWKLGLPLFSTSLNKLSSTILTTERKTIRYRTGEDEHFISLDITDCDDLQYPILDRFSIITEKDILPIYPEELPESEFNDFFQRSAESWKPYAASLPWIRDRETIEKTLRALEEVAIKGADSNQLFLVTSEPGAGGTTFAHIIAYEAAKAGFPTLVGKQHYFEPNATELTSFLFRLKQRYLEANKKGNGSDYFDETASLIVFDVQHWRGQEQKLQNFVRTFIKDSRPSVILVVMEPSYLAYFQNVPSLNENPLTHALSQEEVLELGKHLNVFLRPKGYARSEEEWTSYWRITTPQIGDLSKISAAFWISLGFWLKRQLDLEQNIQSWLYNQFRQIEDVNEELQRIVLRIAGMSLNKYAFPEGLLPNAPAGTLPYSVALEEVKRKVPALCLTRLVDLNESQWIVGHSLLARYLLSAAFQDRKGISRLGYEDCPNIVRFQLELLSEIASDKRLGTKRYRKIAEDFATTILKLDRDRNREFFGEWRRVLEILENVPDIIWNTSRTFNHHVAISRRRVASDDEMFFLNTNEKKLNLELAIEHLEYALEKLPPTDEEDERDLNILNSLARAYQDLAELESKIGSSDELVQQLRKKAETFIQRAISENPDNSYVLETYARNLLQKARLSPLDSVDSACKALEFIHRGLSLNSALIRQEKLVDLLGECLNILREEGSVGLIQKLWQSGNPLGCAAKAWLELEKDNVREPSYDFSKLPSDRILKALEILNEIPSQSRTWLDSKLKYDLICVQVPHDFNQQIEILEVLQGTRIHFNMQMRLEYAILNYQVGRYEVGSQVFRELRKELARADFFIVVPQRLRMLWDKTGKSPLMCEAVVVEEKGFRSRGRVRDLGRDLIPFIPRDFGKLKLPVGSRFYCFISFGPNGPFIRPAT